MEKRNLHLISDSVEVIFDFFFFLFSGLCWEKECPLLEGADFCSSKAQYCWNQYDHKTLKVKHVLPSLLLQDQNIQHFVSCFILLLTVFPLEKHNGVKQWLYFIWFWYNTLSHVFILYAILNSWISILLFTTRPKKI